MMVPKGKKGKKLSGAALDSRISSLFSIIDSAIPPSEEMDEPREEILSHSEKALPTLISHLKYGHHCGIALDLITKIEEAKPGSLLKHMNELKALFAKFHSREWVRKGMDRIIPMLHDSVGNSVGNDYVALNRLFKEIKDLSTNFEANRKKVNAQIKKIGWDKRKEAQDAAEERLVKMGERAVPHLIAITRTRIEPHLAGTPEVHNQTDISNALWALGSIEEKQPGMINRYGGLPAIVDCLHLDDKTAMENAANVLIQIGPASILHLARDRNGGKLHAKAFRGILLREPEKSSLEITNICAKEDATRSKLIEYIATISKAKEARAAINGITPLLDSVNNLERALGVQALSKSRVLCRETTPLLEKAIWDKSRTVAYHAAFELLRRGKTDAVAAAYKNPLARDAARAGVIEFVINAEDRTKAANALKIIDYGPATLIPDLINTAVNAKGKDNAVAIISSLGVEAVPHLQLGSEDYVKSAISLFALKRIIKECGGYERFKEKVGRKQADALLRKCVNMAGFKGEEESVRDASETNAEIRRAKKADSVEIMASKIDLHPAAAEILLMAGDDALPLFTKKLLSPKAMLYGSHLKSMAWLVVGNPETPNSHAAISALIQVAGNPEDSNFKVEASKAIFRIGEPVLVPLINAIDVDSSAKDLKRCGRLSSALAELVVENELREAPELLEKIPKYLERVENGHHQQVKWGIQLLVAMGKPAIAPVLERLEAAEKGSEARRNCLAALAYLLIEFPKSPEIKKFLPEFAEQALGEDIFSISKEFDFPPIKAVFSPESKNKPGPKMSRLARDGLPMLQPIPGDGKSKKSDGLKLQRVRTVFRHLLIGEGREGLHALLAAAKECEPEQFMNFTELIIGFRESDPKMMKAEAKALTPFVEQILDALESHTDAAEEILIEIGIPAIEPILKRIEHEDSGATDFWGVLDPIVERNKGDPGLLPLLPLMLKEDEYDKIAFLGPSAVPALLHEFEKHPEKHEEIQNALKAINSKFRNVDNGVVAKTERPEDLARALRSMAQDVNLGAFVQGPKAVRAKIA